MAANTADYTSPTDVGYQPSDADYQAAMNRPAVGAKVGIFIPDNPHLPANQNYGWTNSMTGQHISGGLSADGKTIVAGFGGGNAQNTQMFDVQTGALTQADPHPWLDVAKNAALIWGGPETAGLAAGLYGAGAGGAAAAGGGGAASAAPAAGAFTPAAGGIGAAGTAGTVAAGGATGAGVGGTAAGGFTLANALKTAAPIAQGILGGVAAGKQAEQQNAYLGNQQALQAAALAQAGQANQVNQQLAQKQLQTSDYQRNYRNALLATLLNGVQDVNINVPADVAAHMGTVSGGLRPSAMPARAQIGGTVLPQALTALGSNPSTTNLLPPSAGVPPNLTPLPSLGKAGTALAIAAPILTGAANFSSLFPSSASGGVTTGGVPFGNNNPMGNTTFAPSQTAGAFGFNPFYVPGAFGYPPQQTPTYFGGG
jgi:hypothetical protein